jgi:hypothetical protein
MRCATSTRPPRALRLAYQTACDPRLRLLGRFEKVDNCVDYPLVTISPDFPQDLSGRFPIRLGILDVLGEGWLEFGMAGSKPLDQLRSQITRRRSCLLGGQRQCGKQHRERVHRHRLPRGVAVHRVRESFEL